MKRLSLSVLLLTVVMVGSCGKNEVEKKIVEPEQTKELSLPKELLKDKSEIEKAAAQIKEKGGPNLRVWSLILRSNYYAFVLPNPEAPHELQLYNYFMEKMGKRNNIGWHGPFNANISITSGDEFETSQYIDKRLIKFDDINLLSIPDYVQKFIDSAKHNGVTITSDMVDVSVENNDSGSYYFKIESLSKDRRKAAVMNLANDGSVIDFNIRKLYSD